MQQLFEDIQFLIKIVVFACSFVHLKQKSQLFGQIELEKYVCHFPTLLWKLEAIIIIFPFVIFRDSLNKIEILI